MTISLKILFIILKKKIKKKLIFFFVFFKYLKKYILHGHNESFQWKIHYILPVCGMLYAGDAYF